MGAVFVHIFGTVVCEGGSIKMQIIQIRKPNKYIFKNELLYTMKALITRIIVEPEIRTNLRTQNPFLNLYLLYKFLFLPSYINIRTTSFHVVFLHVHSLLTSPFSFEFFLFHPINQIQWKSSRQTVTNNNY